MKVANRKVSIDSSLLVSDEESLTAIQTHNRSAHADTESTHHSNTTPQISIKEPRSTATLQHYPTQALIVLLIINRVRIEPKQHRLLEVALQQSSRLLILRIEVEPTHLDVGIEHHALRTLQQRSIPVGAEVVPSCVFGDGEGTEYLGAFEVVGTTASRRDGAFL